MSKQMLKKTSGLLAALLIVSLLAPIIAFAASIQYDELKFNRSTNEVSGVVYTTYDPLRDSVVVNVYDADGNLVGVANAVYDDSRTVSGVTYYEFKTTVSTNEEYLFLSSYLTDTVLGVVYDDSKIPVKGEWAVIGPIGGGVIGSEKITIGEDGYVDPIQLRSSLNANAKVELVLLGDTAQVPADVLAEFADKEGATLVFVSQKTGATYTLPLSAIDFDALAEAFGGSLANVKLVIGIKQVDEDTQAAIEDAAAQLDADVAANAIDFTLEAVGSDGKKVEVQLGTYINRTINVNEEVDGQTATGVVYDPATGKFSFVPSTFSTEDGKTTATLKRNSNSIYTVLKVSGKTFTDVPANYWAKDDIELLARKLIVNGNSATTFGPKLKVTRAEFAALVVRALGLNEAAADNKFSDVVANKWYAGSVAAAAAAGIVKGDPNGKFRPEDPISREELAAMVVRAMKYAGENVELTDAEINEALKGFKDAGKLKWSKAEVAVAVKAGIVEGYKNNINPTDNALRAEAVAMLKRFLTNVGFI